MAFIVKRSGRIVSVLGIVLLVGAAPLASSPIASAAAAPALNYAVGASDIQTNCAAAIERAKEKISATLRARSARTFETVVVPLEDAFADLNDETVAETLASSVSTDAAARTASFTCQNDQSTFQNTVTADPMLYAAVDAASKSGTATTRADRKLTTLWLVSLERAGAGLSTTDRTEFVALSNELAKLQTDYSSNLGNDKTTIVLTPAQTRGLSPDFLASLKKSGANDVVPVNESTFQPFDDAEDPIARKMFFLALFNRQYPANAKLLERAIAVRDRLAHLMGYPSYAAYVLADNMAQTPKRVDDFLASLDAQLLPRAKADVAVLAAMKAKDLGVKTATIEPWDLYYYENRLRKIKYTVDERAIAQYFPVEHVERAVFDIYSKLLGVTFAKRVSPNVWNSDVTEWTVTDTASGRYIGDFYLDLFPREGKYSHFASFPLLPNRTLADGHARPPLDAIIGNWPKPAPGKPAVLTHADVETFFHEFGHDMATMLATTPYETLSSGFRIDFVEAPSQMLENWVWDPHILKQLSSNVTTGRPLPDDLIAKMRAARYFDYSQRMTQQISYATVDMRYHSSGPTVDTTSVWQAVAAADTATPLPADLHPQAGFTHLMSGYAAGYYSYLWSKVYAQDMFTAFQSGGLESADVGARYRHEILEPARELEPDAEVHAFLGRDMSPKAFYAEFDQEPGASTAALRP